MIFPLILLVVLLGGGVFINYIAKGDDAQTDRLFWYLVPVIGIIFLIEGATACIKGDPIVHMKTGVLVDGKQLIGVAFVMLISGSIMIIRDQLKKRK